MLDTRATRGWRARARCREGNPEGLDPELWFPVGTTGPALEQATRAKELCAGCPVMVECLAWALEYDEVVRGDPLSGVWGGTTEDERALLRRVAVASARTG